MEKFVENCKISKKFGYQDKFWTKYMSNSVKKSCLVLKVKCLDLPMKIVS